MTDNEIIKALECCRANNRCDTCPRLGMNCCMNLLMQNALDLINRQVAEVERLQEKSIADDKLLNDRVQESVNAVSKANQRYVEVLEKAFNDKVAELKTAKVEIERWRNALMGECVLSKCSREKEIKAEAYKEVEDRLLRYIYGETNNMIYLTKTQLKNLVKEMTEVKE